MIRKNSNKAMNTDAKSLRFFGSRWVAMDILAAQLMIPPDELVGDLNPQVSAPCRAHKQKGKTPPDVLPIFSMLAGMAIDLGCKRAGAPRRRSGSSA